VLHTSAIQPAESGQTIGDVEIERLTESRSNGRLVPSRSSTSHDLQRQVEPLVMASEITGLAPLRGFLTLGNLVVRLRFPFVTLPIVQPKFIERPRPARHDPAAASTPTTVPQEVGAQVAQSPSSPSHGHYTRYRSSDVE
jgi:hypothetical protein